MNKEFLETGMMKSNDEHSQSDNPYAAPASDSCDSQTDQAETSELRYLRAFVGRNADYYLSNWRLSLEHKEARTGFNWAACLLSGLWLGYRKMYFVALIFFAIILLESIAEELLFVVILGNEESPGMLSNIVGILAGVICGAYGNRWYLSHAQTVISMVQSQGLEEQAAIKSIARKGGTSLGAALGLFMLFLIATFGVFIILAFALYPAE